MSTRATPASSGTSSLLAAQAKTNREKTAIGSRIIGDYRTLRPQSWQRDCNGELGEGIMSFGLYIVGFIVLIIGLAMGAYLLHVPARWIGVGVVVMIGLGILTGVVSTRRPDPS